MGQKTTTQKAQKMVKPYGFPFGCIPRMGIMTDRVHRAILEMVFPAWKICENGEYHSNLVRGDALVGGAGLRWVQRGVTRVPICIDTAKGISETCWYYRNYSRSRNWARASLGSGNIRIYWLHIDTHGDAYYYMGASVIEEFLSHFTWPVCIGVLCWCGIVRDTRWTDWEMPGSLLQSTYAKIRGVAWDVVQNILHVLMTHLYIRFGEEDICYPYCLLQEHAHGVIGGQNPYLMPRDIDGETHNTVSKGKAVSYRYMGLGALRERVCVGAKQEYRLLPWSLMRMWGQDEFSARWMFLIRFNVTSSGRHNIWNILKLVYGGQDISMLVRQRSWVLQTIMKIMGTERFMAGTDWEIQESMEDIVGRYGKTEAALHQRVRYRLLGLGEVEESGKDWNQWYRCPMDRIRVRDRIWETP